MSLKVRLTVLLGVLLAVFLIVLQVLRQRERAQAAELAGESLLAGEQQVQRWIDLTSQPLRRLAQDYGRWDELVNFVGRRDPAWAEANLRRVLRDYGAHALWVLDPGGRPVYSAQQNPGPTLPPPFDPAAPARLHYFAESRDGLLEVWCESIGAENSESAPVGRLLVSRPWNASFLAMLSRLTEARLVLVPAGDRAPAGSDPAELRLPLRNQTGRILRQLQGPLASPDVAGALAGDLVATRLLVVFALLVVVAVWLAVRQWVQQPLGRIAASLARGDPAPLGPLLRDGTEFARVAQLVESSFAQKSALQREIEEHRQTEAALRESEKLVRLSLEVRARLARDLHDGVIQSIYAAGLGLESALTQLEQDQPGARARLQLCRQSLNDVIRQVRAFINGLEPEQSPGRGFAAEVATLGQTMQALWPVRIAVDVNPLVASRLSATQEVHALQVVRECISNALRHGNAKEVHIWLNQAGDGARLTVRDDGCGFEPGQPAGPGSGLLNLATRAREMDGKLELDAQPGKGVAVMVTFALAASPL
jgi:signal transduction histidine kinase